MTTLPQPGDLIGGFRVVRELGRGGMGAVYECVDSALDRRVAVKVLLPGLAELGGLERRFGREATILARLRSPHITPVLSFGESEGRWFLVSELFVDGDLRAWVRRVGPLEPTTALEIVVDVAEGLSDAHGAGVLHRDVKPSNILLWRRRSRLRGYLCDFGIAHALDSSVTRTGGVLGSLAYMAPERHTSGDADARSDLYSLGCVLWAALTGAAPYAGTDFRVMSSHVHDPVPQLPGASETDVDLNALLKRLMAKDPDDRPATADRVVEDCEALIEAWAARAAPSAVPVSLPARHAPRSAPAPTPAPASTSVPEPAPASDPEPAPGPVGSHDATTVRPSSPDGSVSGPPVDEEPTPGPPSENETDRAEEPVGSTVIRPSVLDGLVPAPPPGDEPPPDSHNDSESRRPVEAHGVVSPRSTTSTARSDTPRWPSAPGKPATEKPAAGNPASVASSSAPAGRARSRRRGVGVASLAASLVLAGLLLLIAPWTGPGDESAPGSTTSVVDGGASSAPDATASQTASQEPDPEPPSARSTLPKGEWTLDFARIRVDDPNNALSAKEKKTFSTPYSVEVDFLAPSCASDALCSGRVRVLSDFRPPGLAGAQYTWDGRRLVISSRNRDAGFSCSPSERTAFWSFSPTTIDTAGQATDDESTSVQFTRRSVLHLDDPEWCTVGKAVLTESGLASPGGY